MTRNLIAALALAASLFTPPLAHAEGPQERALDKSLQREEQDNESAPAIPAPAAQQPAGRTTASTNDETPLPTARSPKVGSSAEGPEEQSLDRSLMEYRLQQDRDASAPPAEAAQ